MKIKNTCELNGEQWTEVVTVDTDDRDLALDASAITSQSVVQDKHDGQPLKTVRIISQEVVEE